MRSRRNPRPSPAGFTLVEVLVALSIMSMLMVALYTTLNSTLKARDQLETEARTAGLGPALLDIIEADLRRAWVLDIEGDQVFKGESRTMDGEPADTLAFLTSVDSSVSRRVDEREVPSDVCETGYRLRRNPVFQDVMELWRRQSFHVDDKPLEDGVYERLHDRVVSFQVRYVAEVDKYAEKLADWDASALHRLPALVDIELGLEVTPRSTDPAGPRGSAHRTLHYHRVIDMRRDSDICMRLHGQPPAFKASGEGDTGTNPDGSPKKPGEGGAENPDGTPTKPNGPGGPDGPFGPTTGGDNPPDLGDLLGDLLGGGG